MKKINVKKFLFMLILLFIAFTIVSFFLKEFVSNYFVRLHMETIDVPIKDSRLLVIAPHSDDEILGAGGLIYKTLQNGGQVKVILITNGDGSISSAKANFMRLRPKPAQYIEFGYIRQQETIDALSLVGLSKEDIIFLGYPDRGTSYLWSSYWDNPYRSVFTHSIHSPYANSYTTNASYSGESLHKDLSDLIMSFAPTHLVYPHPNDRHPDHWGINAFVKYTITVTDYKPVQELLYLVHRGDWPTPMKRSTSMYLVPPAKLIDTGTLWKSLDLGEEAIQIKTEAIRSYKTQMKTLGYLLTAFERKNEMFGEYPNAILSQKGVSINDIKPDRSNLLINDPKRDALNLKVGKGADIEALYGELSDSGDFVLFLEADGNIDRLVSYCINLVLISNESTQRLNIEIKNKRLKLLSINSQSVTNLDGLVVGTDKKFLKLVIPKALISDLSHIFLNAHTTVEGYVMDRSAWRMIETKPLSYSFDKMKQ